MVGEGVSSPLKQTRYQLLLGNDSLIAWHKTPQEPESLRDVSTAQRRAVSLTLEEYKQRHETIDEAMAQAYYSGTDTMTQIGEYFGVHAETVGRAVRKHEQREC